MATLRGSRNKHVEIRGAKELQEMLQRTAPEHARNVLRAAVHGLAAKARDKMQQRVAKDTGKLSKSLVAVRRRGEPDFPKSDVRGGADAPYALMLEFGTSKTQAQPFITPTVEELRAEQEKEFREEFFKKLEKSLARAAKKKASL